MGQCTSKHGVRKEGEIITQDLNEPRRNLGAKNQSYHPEDTTVKSLSAIEGKSKNKNLFLGAHQSALSSPEETTYSSDFCEEEESFATADTSSRSMRYPPSRKSSSVASRKTSSVTPSSYSPDKQPSTSISYFSTSGNNDENKSESSESAHNPVKKPGCEMFVIDFEDDIASITSPKKRVSLSCMFNKRPHQLSSATNTPKKNSKLNIRNDKVSDGKLSQNSPRVITKRSPNSDKRLKNKKNSVIENNKTKSSGLKLVNGVICTCPDENQFDTVKNKVPNLSVKGNIISKNNTFNKKLEKDKVNQKIKNSPKNTFLKRKSKDDKKPNAKDKDGK